MTGLVISCLRVNGKGQCPGRIGLDQTSPLSSEEPERPAGLRREKTVILGTANEVPTWPGHRGWPPDGASKSG